jgi:light-regulated signal transduction histidine kinase (bacteriophytochrome)
MAPLVVEPLDMDELVGGVIQNLSEQIHNKDAVVTVGNLPKCHADSIQVNQIFTNLIDNSLKYFDPEREGKIHVSGVISEGSSIYCIEDNGIGIAPEYADSIFEIFQRVRHEQLIAGEGLGLTIVKRLAARNNGKVWLESELSVGTKFYVSLPIVRTPSIDQ